MKKIYFLFLTLIFSYSALGQTIFTQNFEGSWTIPSSLSPSWSGTTTPADNQWQRCDYTTGWTSSTGAYSPLGANSTSYSARFHTYDAASGTSGDFITPTIDLSAYSAGTVKLNFYHINTTGTDVLNIYSSSDNGATWSSALAPSPIGVSAAWTLKTITLPGNSATTKIKFTATGDYGTTDIGIDEIKVYFPVAANGVPITFTATSVTQTGMTIGWTDNSTNETAFRVYRSTDNITFVKVGSDVTSTTMATIGTTYSQVQSGLVPGTTYYYRITAVADIESAPLTGSWATVAGGNILSTGTGGLWSQTSTWVGGVVPVFTDNVTIVNGATVTIDITTATCWNLTVGQGTSGILIYLAGTASTLTVNGGVTVAAGGSFNAGSGALTTHILYIGGSTNTAPGTGSIINNGIFDMYTTAGVTVTFFGSPDASISGTGATLDFYRVVLNKGATTATATVTPPILDLQRAYTVTGVATTALLYTFTAGVLKISGSFTQSNLVFQPAGYTIPALGGFWLNNSTFTVTGQNGSPTLAGLLRVSAGTYNIGTALGNSMGFSTGSVVNIEGGTINGASRFGVSAAANTITYSQSGGTITVCTVANTSTTLCSFDLGTSVSSTINISNGTIIIQNVATGATVRDYRNQAGTGIAGLTGGTLQIGNASTPAAKSFTIYGVTPNLVINGTFAHTVTWGAPVNYNNCSLNITISATTTLNIGNNIFLFAGTTLTDNGIFIGTGASSRLYFYGAVPLAMQTFTGTGVVTAPLTSFDVDNSFGVNVTSTNNVPVTRIILFTGGVTGSGKLTLGNGAATTGTIQIGNTTTPTNAGVFDAPLTFNLGTGGEVISYLRTGSSRTTGNEVTPTRALTSMTFDDNDVTHTLTIAGGNLSAGTLNLTNGIIISSAANLLTVSGTATTSIVGGSTAAYVNGPLARTLPASLLTGSTYPLPVGKGTYNPLELVNPTTNAGGTVVIKAEAFDANCSGTAGLNMGALNSNRYWGASITSGGANFTNTFIRLNDASVVSSSAIAASATSNGTYDIVGGTSPTIVVGTSVLSAAPAATSMPGFYVIGTKSVSMTYISSTTTQANTNAVAQGTTNAEVMGIQVVTSGNASPLSVTSFTVNANGTTNVSDITNAKIYYTGTSSTFATTTQFGSTVASPTVSNYSITGSQVLAEGTNYFWITYDVPSTATLNNYIDAECTSLTVGFPQTPTLTNPSGNRQILNQSVIGSGVATATWPVYRYYNYSTWECIYLQSELGTVKDITSIAFNKSSGADIVAITPVTVYMKHTSATILTTGKYDLTGYTQVFTGTFQNTATSGWMEMVLNTAFSYNGTDNLQILIVRGYQAYTSSYPYYYSTTAATNRARQGYSDTEQPGITGGTIDLTASTNVPNLRYNFALPVPKSLSGITYNQASTSAVILGSLNKEILRLDFAVAGSTGTLSLNSIVVSSNNTSDADISNVKLFRTSSPVFSTANQLGTSQTFSGGTATFSSLNYDLPGFSTTYIWVAYDISGTATVNNLADARITANSINVAGSTYPVADQSPAGSRTIRGPLNGPYDVGTGKVYPKIIDAIADLALLGVSGPVIFNLTDATYPSETFPIIINAYTGASATNTVTIKPASGVNASISGASASSLIKFNGASYLTIDGSNNGTSSQNLTLTNTTASGTTAVVWIGSNGTGAGTNYITVKNCNLANGFNIGTSYGIFAGASSGLGTAGNDNDNLTLQNNNINTSYYGIWAQATSAAGQMDNLQMIGNSIGSATSANYIGYSGINIAYASGALISQNTIFNIITSVNWTPVGMTIGSGVVSSTISRNNINNVTWSTAGGYGGRGLYVNTGNAASNLTIANNLLYVISGDGFTGFSNSSPVGMYFDGTTGGLNIYHNSVYMSGNLSYTSATLTAAILFYTATITNINLRNNIFQNSMVNSVTSGSKSYVIFSATAPANFTQIDNNDYFDGGSQAVLGFLPLYSDITTLAAWQAATGKDVYSANVNPNFVSTTDLHTAKPRLNNGGVSIPAVTVDYTGATRTNPPDIGAYEYTLAMTGINTLSATAVGQTTATVNGNIDSNGEVAAMSFDYGLNLSYGSSGAGTPSPVRSLSSTAVSSALTLLTPNTLYHYRIKGTSTTSAEVKTGNDLTFTTLPSPTITGPATVCQGSTGNVYTTESGMTNYQWTVSAGGSITLGGGTGDYTVTVTWTGTGAQTVSVNYSNVTGPAPSPTVYNITSNPLPVPALGGPVTRCQGTTGNVYTTDPGMSNYIWTVSAGGSITSGGGTGDISATVTWTSSGSQSISVNYTDGNGCTAASPTVTTVTVNALPVPVINGTSPVCYTESWQTYTTAAGMTNYTWTATGGSIVDGGGTTDNYVSVSWPSTGTYPVTVSYTDINGCTAAAPTTFYVTLNDHPVPTISGPASVCIGSASNVYTTESGMTNYLWTVSAGGSVTLGGGTGDNTVTVTWGSAGPQTVSVNYTDGNGCTAVSPTDYSVFVHPLPNLSITGPTPVCAGSTGNTYNAIIMTKPNYIGPTGTFVWTISSGGVITGGGTTSDNYVTVTWNTAGAETVTLLYTDGNGCTAASPTIYNVTVNTLPVPTISGSTIVCEGSYGYTYTTESGMTNYVWTVSSGGTISAGGTSTDYTADIDWLTPGAESVTVNYTDANGCTASSPAIKNVTVNPRSVPSLSGPGAACAGSTGYVYTTDALQSNYTWFISSGGSIASGGGTGDYTVTVTWNSAGNQSVGINYQNTVGCWAYGSTSLPVIVTPNPVPTITGPSTVCANSAGNVYSTPNIVGHTYAWAISGGTITGGDGTNSITVTWNAAGSGWVQVTETITATGCAVTTAQYNVTIYALPVPTITGSGSICGLAITQYHYVTEANMSNYTWTVSAGGNINVGQSTNDITVSWFTAGAQTVTVTYSNYCNAAAPTSKIVNVYALPVPSIAGPSSVCAGSTVHTYSANVTYSPVSPTFTYYWTVSPGGSITGGGNTYDNYVMVTWNTAGARTVSLSVTDAYGCSSASPAVYPVTVNPLPVPTITGPASICGIPSAGNHYVTESGKSGYTWTVSSGGSITAGSTTNDITVTWSTSGAKTVTVNYADGNGCGAATPTSYAVNVYDLPVPTITGAGTICGIPSSGNHYITEPLMSGYSWTVSAGGSITAGSTTNDITVTWSTTGPKTVTVTYTDGNGCNPAAPTSKTVNVYALPVPSFLGGPTALCGIPNNGNIYTTDPGMSNYSWTVSAGGSIFSGSGTNSITVNWSTTGAKTVTVTYTDTHGCNPAIPTSLTTNVYDLPVPTITGPATAILGSTGNLYTTEAGKTNYLWSVSAGGTPTSGGGTTDNTVTVTWNSAGSQTVSVSYKDGNGCTAASPTIFNVSVSSVPGPAGSITGVTPVCQGQIGVAYSVAPILNATGYFWTLPSGATVATGGNTNSITVDYSMSAVSGNITVYGTNIFGNGTTSPPFAVTVNPTPTVDPVSNQVVCTGTSTAPVTFTGSMPGAIYNWVNNAPAIGLAASGTGNIGAFTASSAGASPLVATVTVTPVSSGMTTQTFSYTGGMQTWTVPAGVTSITIETYGASGSNGTNNPGGANGGPGGKGSKATGTLGGINSNPTGGPGGDGDGNGTNGANSLDGGGGFAGIGQIGGLKGIGCSYASGLPGSNGITLSGGAGGAGSLCCTGTAPPGGGGGGGYFGGGGGGGGSAGTVGCTGSGTGGGGGGAGGTSYLAGVTGGALSTGIQTGDGLIKISYGSPGSCTGTPVSFTITANPNATISLTSAPGTNIQSLCINTPITNITYSIGGGGTGAGVVGLPTGVNGVYAAGVFTISGTPTVSGTFNYTVTTTGTCVQATATGTITVNILPVPTITGPTMSCTGLASTYTTEGGMSGYLWTVSAGGSILSGQGTSFISVLWSTAGAQTVSVNYATGFGCFASSPTVLNVTVNPRPAPTISGPTPVCINSSGNTYTTEAGKIYYVWSYSPGGTVTGGGTVNDNFVTVTWNFAGAQVVQVNYENAFGCSAFFPTIYPVVVNPLPIATATPSSQTICSGSSITSIVLSSSVGGTTYTWTRDNSATVTGIAASGSGNISGSLTNTTFNPITVTFTITPTANGCAGPTTTATVLVNPTPNAIATPSSQTICSGSAITSIVLTSSTTGTTYAWTRDNTATVTGIAASGSGNISGSLTNTTTSPVTVTFTITPTANGCPGTPTTATVMVNPIPDVNPVSNQVVCNGTATAPVTFSGSIPGTTFNWTNSTPSIGLAASGAGNIASFTATNGGTSPVVANVTVTPSITTPLTFTYNGSLVAGDATLSNRLNRNGIVPTCASPKLYPGPFGSGLYYYDTYTFTNTTGSSQCISVTYIAPSGGDVFVSAYNGSFNPANLSTNYLTDGGNSSLGLPVTFSFNVANGATIVLVANVADVPICPAYTITVTGLAVTCTGSPISFNYTVNPSPNAVATPSSQTICSGSAITTIALSGSVAGTTYNWTRDNTVSVTGIAASGSGNISGSLTNTTFAPITVTFTITPTANGCSGTPVTATVLVNPTPNAIATPSSQTICSGSAITTIALTSSTAGTTYTWTRDNTATVTGIAASGSGNISGTLTNTTTAPVTVTFTITPTANGCTGPTTTATVLVNPTPNALATPSSQTICSGATITTIVLTSSTTGTTYTWTRNNTATVTGIAASGSGNISGSLTNTTFAPITVTFTITPTANGCAGPTTTATVLVNPTPNAIATPSSQTICSASAITTIVLTSSTTGTTYTWTRDNTVTVTGIAASGSGNISGSLTNTTFAPITVTFTITPTANGCPGPTTTAMVLVNPTPNAIATPSSQTICSGTAITTIALTSSTVGTTFTWTRDNTVSVTGIAASGSGNISGNLTNTTFAPITVTFTITPTASGCVGPTTTATVLVNPTPNATATPSSQTICSGSAITTIALSGSVTGTTYTWTRDNTVSVTGIAASGSGNISGSLTNTTFAPITVTFTITPAANGCNGPTTTATVLVNPTPNAIATPSSQTICSGSAITTIVLTSSTAGTTYTWTRNNTVAVTGIAASGSGNISGNLTNTTTAPVTVTFTITPTANGCTGPTTTATVLVNPTPNAVAAPSSQTICSGSAITTIVLSGSVAGTTYTWTRDNTVTVTGIAASGSGNISGNLTNTTFAPITVTFTITPTANGCPGPTTTATVLVNPTPNAIASPSSQTICSGTAITTIALTSSTAGTTYTWTRDNTATVTGIAASGSGNISGSLTNTTFAPVTVTFTITPTANGCVGPTTTATVLVNPTPNAVATPSSQTICSGATITTIALTGSVAGTTFNWTRDNNATVTGIAASGSGNISGILTNTTLAPILVTFTITPVAYGCNGPTITATVLVNPSIGIPVFVLGPTSTRCQGIATVTYTATSVNSTGISYTLDAASLAAGNTINGATGAVTYTAGWVGVSMITAIANGCNGPSSSYHLSTTNPRPMPTITGPASVCVGTAGNVYTTQAGMTGYTWTISAGGLITGGNGTSSITVTWNTAGAQTISVNYSNGFSCPALVPFIYNVIVNPLPVPTITGPATACMGSTGNVYTTQAGMSGYTWTVSAGGIIAGGTGTNAVTVTWNTAGAQTISVTYTNGNGCTAAAPTVYNVTVSAAPVPTITGTTNLCVNSGYYNYTTESGMTNYVWNVSAGGIINFGSGTNQIQISWIGSGAQTVSVIYTSATGCPAVIPAVLNVTVNPLPGSAGSITGTAVVCGGTNGVAYSTPVISGAVTYIWTLPVGATIATGSGTNSITVNYAANASSGNITVAGNNMCGNGTASPPFLVTVTTLPDPAGTITGPALVCQGDMGKVYTVPAITGATGYVWSFPAGAAIVGGNNTNSVTVDFAPTASSGIIVVAGTNSCGSGTVSPNFNLTVNPLPPTPVVTNTGYIVSSSAATGNQWYYSTTIGGTGAPISGATGQTYDATLTGTGYYWVVVTVNGCSAVSNRILVITTGIETLSSSVINLFPVPNDGRFTVTFSGTSTEIFTISIFNNLGVKIFEELNLEMNGMTNKVIDLRPVPNGVYTVIFHNSQKQVVKKIVVNK
ncbi:MAG: T9SS type A sorting domain-containing protein [Bacteroidetes bacterium]|nr:T9SS type A sorting domain-containing protein [Bacteroidota bacterium]